MYLLTVFNNETILEPTVGGGLKVNIYKSY